MPTTITSVRANEKGTLIVSSSFTDEDGTAVIPETLTWTISKTDGTIVNARQDVAASAAETVKIVLSGDDLQIFPGDNLQRVLTLKATYNSTLGTGLPLNDEVYFSIEDLVNVA